MIPALLEVLTRRATTGTGPGPSVSINPAGGQADPTTVSSIAFAVVFSRAVTGFTGGDCTFTGSTAGGTLAAAVTGSGASYTVTVTGMTSPGDVVLNIPAGGAIDSGGRSNLASVAPSTITFGAAGTYLTYGSRSEVITLAAPAGIADGDLLIAYISDGQSGSAPTAITLPTGWHTLTGSPGVVTDSFFFINYNVFYKIASSESGSYVFTVGTPGTYSSCGVILRYRGVDPATPFSPTPTKTIGTGGTATATGFTTTVNNTFIIFTEQDWGNDTSDTFAPPGTTPPFTERIDATLIYIADGAQAVQIATGDKSHLSNSGSGNPWASYLIGLKPDPGSGDNTVAFAASTSVYGAWSNFPQSDTFFPISAWLANPNRSMGGTAPASTLAACAVLANVNILMGIDNGGTAWPTSFGSGDSNGYLAAIKAAGLLLIPECNLSNNTAADSIASILALASSMSATANLVGWNMGDEPACGTVISAIPGQVTTLKGFDSTRPLFCNQTDFPFGHGLCSPPTQNTDALKAVDIGSFDLYPIISPWNGTIPGTPQDTMWIQGYSVVLLRQSGRPGQPIWAFVEAGTDALGYSSQNGNTCSSITNLCTPNNNEFRATNEQINAEVWMSLINGAVGIEWFIHDSTALALGLGESGNTLANSLHANLAYINGTILSYAQKLNATTLGMATMITGTDFTNFVTSATNGILTIATGNSSMPASALVKSFSGTHYLFAQTARNGTGTLTFTLSGDNGKTATVAYDSNAHYDSAHSSVGSTFTLNSSGVFSDTFGANSHDYQVKIYSIS